MKKETYQKPDIKSEVIEMTYGGGSSLPIEGFDPGWGFCCPGASGSSINDNDTSVDKSVNKRPKINQVK